jgi:hypothetical protein
MTITRISGASAAARTAAVSSAISVSSNALWTFGRASPISSTGPWRTTSRVVRAPAAAGCLFFAIVVTS